MNANEMKEFIEEMENIDDIWTLKQVKEVYGDYSLEDALLDRKNSVNMYLKNIINTFSFLAGEDDEWWWALVQLQKYNYVTMDIIDVLFELGYMQKMKRKKECMLHLKKSINTARLQRIRLQEKQGW